MSETPTSLGGQQPARHPAAGSGPPWWTAVPEPVCRFVIPAALILLAFTAAVLGGIGNLTGAVTGAVVIGLIEAFNEGLTWNTPGSDWTRSIVFGILIAILVFRPEGILGERTPEGG